VLTQWQPGLRFDCLKTGDAPVGLAAAVSALVGHVLPTTARQTRPQLRLPWCQVGELRQEILKAQQARSDLLKWKLGLVGAIGAVGLGLAGSRVSSHADLVLCAVPLVCVYVDLLCHHLSLRILVIGTFLWTSAVAAASEAEAAEWSVLRAYEAHVQKARQLERRLHRRLPNRWSRHTAFALEDGAVTWSTFVLSAALVVYGRTVQSGHSADPRLVGAVFILAGLVGLAASLLGRWFYTGKFKQVLEIEQSP
jgi:hypothetical protein